MQTLATFIRRARRRLLALAFILQALAGCPQAEDERDEAVATPDRQFVFEQLSIEERRGGRVIWKGAARRARGDLSSADVEDVVLHYRTRHPEVSSLTLRAPEATLELDAGRSAFRDVQIEDEQGGRLDAGDAHYDEELGTIVLEGPLVFSAEQLSATAPSATMHLEEGTVLIDGPVSGVIRKQDRTTEDTP